jgi:hypothetical protein
MGEFRLLARAIVVIRYRPLPVEMLVLLIGLEPDVVPSLVDKLESILYRDVSLMD